MANATLKQLLSGEFFRRDRIRKQYKLFALIILLVFIYINAGYNALRQQHEISNLRREVRELRFEYLTITAELAQSTKQSAITAELKQRNSKLIPNKTPVIRIK